MDEVWVENFRCFREEQRARLAPLTLLVGENSTGKTSFMAMIRALTEAFWGFDAPDFKASPYDLGSFDEIAHSTGNTKEGPTFFRGGYSAMEERRRYERQEIGRFSYDVTFGRDGSSPVPLERLMRDGELRVQDVLGPPEPHMLGVQTKRGSWKIRTPYGFGSVRISGLLRRPLIPMTFILDHALTSAQMDDQERFVPVDGSPAIESSDIEELKKASEHHPTFAMPLHIYAGAPIRSQPRRTYEPTMLTSDPEGQSIPMYLASMFQQDKPAWQELKARLEGFGKVSGLFDEVAIRFLGKPDVDPFQVQILKRGGRRRSSKRNLVDVGYGVSQALPLITEMLRPDAASMFLLQQPEVHLHPTAQAALGTLFCQVAASNGPQLIVETHSDYVIDRVRMEIRDRVSGLRPEDVSILYFERRDLDVRIHSIEIDKEGNIVGAPEGYRQFFTDELERSLWGSQTQAKA